MPRKPPQTPPIGRYSVKPIEMIQPQPINPFPQGQFTPDYSNLTTPTPTPPGTPQQPIDAASLAMGVGTLGSTVNNIARPEMATGALSGALKGGAAGSFLGPIGTGVGALVGGAVGAVSAGFGQQRFDELKRQQEIDQIQTQTTSGTDLGYYEDGGDIPQKAEPVPIQASKGEMIAHVNGMITPVKATKTHKQMKSDEITDILLPGSFVGSANKKMAITKEQAEEFSFGYEPIVYEENGSSPKLKERTLADFVPKKMTPAQVLRKIKSTYPTTDVDDVFAEAANEGNKRSRAPYVAAVKILTEEQKAGEIQQFEYGGVVRSYAAGGNVFDPLKEYLASQSEAAPDKKLPFSVTGAPQILNFFGGATQVAGIQGQDERVDRYRPNPADISQAFQKIPVNRLTSGFDNFAEGQQKATIDAAARSGATAFEQGAIASGQIAEQSRVRGELGLNAYTQNVAQSRAEGAFRLGVTEKNTAAANQERTFGNQKLAATTQTAAGTLQGFSNISNQIEDRKQKREYMKNVRKSQVASQLAELGMMEAIYGGGGGGAGGSNPGGATPAAAGSTVTTPTSTIYTGVGNASMVGGVNAPPNTNLANIPNIKSNALPNVAMPSFEEATGTSYPGTGITPLPPAANRATVAGDSGGYPLPAATITGERGNAGVESLPLGPIASTDAAPTPSGAGVYNEPEVSDVEDGPDNIAALEDAPQEFTSPGDPYDYRKVNGEWQSKKRGTNQWGRTNKSGSKELERRYGEGGKSGGATSGNKGATTKKSKSTEVKAKSDNSGGRSLQAAPTKTRSNGKLKTKANTSQEAVDAKTSATKKGLTDLGRTITGSLEDSVSVVTNNPFNITDTGFGEPIGSQTPGDNDNDITEFASVEEGVAAYYAKTIYSVNGSSSTYPKDMTINEYNKKFSTASHAPKAFRSIAKRKYGVTLTGKETIAETIQKVGGLANFARIMAQKENGPLYKQLESQGIFDKVTVTNYKDYLK